jgi:cell wall assembly regulator SMI1
MGLVEFDVLAEELRRRRRSAVSMAEYGFVLVEGLTVTAEKIVRVEAAMGVVLPELYKEFMVRHDDDDEFVSGNFLEFVAARGLGSSDGPH